jgi:putative ATPase
MADGDGRALLNLVEQVAGWGLEEKIGPDALSTRLSGGRRSTTSRATGTTT